MYYILKLNEVWPLELHPDNISFMQFSTKIDGFEQKDSQGFENSYNSYEQYPFFHFHHLPKLYFGFKTRNNTKRYTLQKAYKTNILEEGRFFFPLKKIKWTLIGQSNLYKLNSKSLKYITIQRNLRLKMLINTDIQRTEEKNLAYLKLLYIS